MEYSQTALRYTTQLKPLRLNPYSNGILTDKKNYETIFNYACLNPYSNGILTDIW